MKKWFLSFLIIAFFFPCYLLASCSMGKTCSGMEASNEQRMESITDRRNSVDSSERPSSPDVTQVPSHFEPKTSGEIDFRYFYRGFTAVSLNDREKIKKFMEFGEQTIVSEEEWDAFMASYCPGIPYEEPPNFSDDYLVASITFCARPTYTNSDTITRLIWENGQYIFEYENDPANYIYALNSGEYTHFYVEIVSISREIHANEEKENQGTAPEREDPSSIKGNFRTIYRGFTTAHLGDRETIENFSTFGTKIISAEEDWNAFMASFCPGIPYYESWDFSQECLVASIIQGSRPTYSCANAITSLAYGEGYFIFEYNNDPANCIYALNDDKTTHFYVEVIAVSRKNLPTDFGGLVYHPLT